MDVHTVDGGVSVTDVIEAHKKDLGTQQTTTGPNNGCPVGAITTAAPADVRGGREEK